MAVITNITLVPNVTSALQRLIADWTAYVPVVANTFTLSQGVGFNRRYLQSSVVDPVNTTNSVYVVSDVPAAAIIPPSYLFHVAGASDVSPPVVQPTYGARNSYTDWKANFLTPLVTALAVWTGASTNTLTDLAMTLPPVGMTQNYNRVTMYRVGSVGVLEALFTTRDPVTATLAATGVFPGNTQESQASANPGNGMSEATATRIADALEAIEMTRMDISMNQGSVLYSASTRTSTP